MDPLTCSAAWTTWASGASIAVGPIVTVGSAAAGALIALGVILVVRRGLRPLEAMAAQADRITAGDLTERVGAVGAGSEVERLGGALNGMLARIEASVEEREASQELMRRFFADASHELRTPLARRGTTVAASSALTATAVSRTMADPGPA